MYKNIAFIGGIHGVGKSTVCKSVCEATGLHHLIASEVLKWKDISGGPDKNVANIANTQDRLLKGYRLL